MKLLEHPTGLRVGDWLNENLAGDWHEFRAAVAFVKWSGVKHILANLTGFAQSRRAEVIAGVDHQGTSYEGLRRLLDAVSPNGRVVVFHNKLRHTFHPKVYLFKSDDRAEMVVGSENMTEGGLYTNYELGVQVSLDLGEDSDREMLESIEGVLNRWTDEKSGTATELNDAGLESLVQAGYVLKEAELAAINSGKSSTGMEGISPGDGDDGVQFKAVPVPAAPSVTHPGPVGPIDSQLAGRHFVMTLQKTDVGVGQTQEGTSRRSPEIFVPLKARNSEPGFWDWQDGFAEDPQRQGKFDRRGVRMRVGNEVVEVNMMTWPVKHDFRLRSERLRSLGSIGDILVMEKVDSAAFEYDVRLVQVGSANYEAMHAKCDQSVTNSKKRFGYF